MYDVIIIGGGPAGLSAALILGRCLRKVLIIDNGKQRNLYSQALHGYLTRDGMNPKEFLSTARAELKKYETVNFFEGEAVSARKKGSDFEVELVDGTYHQTKKLLVATGVLDTLPSFGNFMDFYGTSVHTCVYCDGFEKRHQPLAVYGKGERGLKLSLSLRVWTSDIVLLTDGPSEFSSEELETLKRNKIVLNENKIESLEGQGGKLEAIVFDNGEKLERTGLFINTASLIKSKILEHLECKFDQKDGVETGKYEDTNVPGLYVAGNILREVQLVIVAAGQGAEAAFGINTALCSEERS